MNNYIGKYKVVFEKDINGVFVPKIYELKEGKKVKPVPTPTPPLPSTSSIAATSP